MRSDIKAAGDYLLTVLRDDRAVLYSRFYNAEPGTDVALADAVWPFLVSQPAEVRGELDEGDRERLVEEAHVLLDWAAEQLDDLGVVKITTLEGTELIDGEPDFRIDLTERGRHFIESGETFGYRLLESTQFDASKASRWMLDFLEAGGPGQTLTLRDVMDLGYTDGEVSVTDDFGNEYPSESNSYAWAFEVCLWHHARKKHIEPVFEDPAQAKTWEHYMRHEHLPPPPNLDKPRTLWDVPFRLVEGVEPDQVQHVGRIGG